MAEDTNQDGRTRLWSLKRTVELHHGGSDAHLFEIHPVARNLLDAAAFVKLHQVCERVKHVFPSHRISVVLGDHTHTSKVFLSALIKERGGPSGPTPAMFLTCVRLRFMAEVLR